MWVCRCPLLECAVHSTPHCSSIVHAHSAFWLCSVISLKGLAATSSDAADSGGENLTTSGPLHFTPRKGCKETESRVMTHHVSERHLPIFYVWLRICALRPAMKWSNVVRTFSCLAVEESVRLSSHIP